MMRKVGLVFVVTILTIVGCKFELQQGAGSQYFATANGLVELQFPAGWHESREDNPYDLQCFSKYQRMTTGVFLYTKEDLAEGFSSQDLFIEQIDDLRSKRKNFIILEEKETVQLEKKTLITIVYSGEKGALRYYYRFTIVEFSEKPEMLLVVLQVAIPSYWNKHKPILEEITKSARIRLEEPQKGGEIRDTVTSNKR